MKNKKKITAVIVLIVIAAVVLGTVFGLMAAGRTGGTRPAGDEGAAAEAETQSAGGAAGTGTNSTDGSAQGAAEPKKDSAFAVDDEAMAKVISYKGSDYTKRDDIRTILFMGVDQSDDREEAEQTVANGGRADAILLFVLNDTDKTAQLVSLSRDTITDVDAYDANGEYMFSGPVQINMQYAYGDSPKRSCYLMKNKVSEVLYGAGIDGYLSMTMDGIGLITDLLGGITAVLPEDYSYVDPAYTKGAEITFDGESAEKFVRYRDLNELYSNDMRMERQSWFMNQLFKKLSESPNKADLLVSLLDQADAYVETDLEAETIRDLASYDLQEETLKVPGETRAGEKHAEFYIDEDALQEMLVGLYYE